MSYRQWLLETTSYLAMRGAVNADPGSDQTKYLIWRGCKIGILRHQMYKTTRVAA